MTLNILCFVPGRNAVVVVLASGVSFTLDNYGYDGELTITGNVSSGLPSFAVPDFQADGIFTVSCCIIAY